MLSNSIRFISNNVKGIRSFEKRINFFEYLKEAITSYGFIFLQETHSTIHDEKKKKKWNDEFKGKLFFSHGQSNSCGVAICFIGNTSFDQSCRILILAVKVSDNDFLLINLYNANKSEQLNTLSTLCNRLDDITDSHCKKIILGGDFNIFFNITYEVRGGNPKMKNKSVAKFIHMKEIQGFVIFHESESQRKNVIHSDNSMSLVSFKEG